MNGMQHALCRMEFATVEEFNLHPGVGPAPDFAERAVLCPVLTGAVSVLFPSGQRHRSVLAPPANPQVRGVGRPNKSLTARQKAKRQYMRDYMRQKRRG
jgi:hypothetical protein